MAAKKTKSPTVAKTEDGSIQMTLVVPFAELEKARDRDAMEHGKTMTIKGFRKGKAPLEKIKQELGREHLTEHALNGLLPGIFNEAVKKNDIKPAVMPKFELIKAQEGEDWEIRAITAEAPKVELGDYKKYITPIIVSEKDKAEPTREQKEQKAIEALLKNAKVTVPQVLIDDEVNTRLSGLLDRIEKLGLNLDSYLASVKKTADQIREEYKVQAEQTLKLEFILIEIANDQGFEVEEKEIEEFTKAAEANPEYGGGALDTPEQKRTIGSILRKRKTLDYLVSLV